MLKLMDVLEIPNNKGDQVLKK